MSHVGGTKQKLIELEQLISTGRSEPIPDIFKHAGILGSELPAAYNLVELFPQCFSWYAGESELVCSHYFAKFRWAIRHRVDAVGVKLLAVLLHKRAVELDRARKHAGQWQYKDLTTAVLVSSRFGILPALPSECNQDCQYWTQHYTLFEARERDRWRELEAELYWWPEVEPVLFEAGESWISQTSAKYD